MKIQLGDMAKIRFGLYLQPEDAGDTAYLQVKHFDEWNLIARPLDTFININSKRESHLLNDGDILLVGKGMRNFAWTYDQAFGPAIASSIFFVIEADRSRVIPDFLTTLFNLPQAQAYFQTLGAGSSIPSIRKSELEAFTVKLPSLDLQRKAIAIKQLHDKDMELSGKIIAEKQKVFQTVIKTFMDQEHG